MLDIIHDTKEYHQGSIENFVLIYEKEKHNLNVLFDRYIDTMSTTIDAGILKRMIIAIIDLFSKVQRTFRALPAKLSSKKFAKSELWFYLQGNKLMVKSIFNLNYTDVAKTLVLNTPYTQDPIKRLTDMEGYANNVLHYKNNKIFDIIKNFIKDVDTAIKDVDNKKLKDICKHINTHVIIEKDIKAMIKYLTSTTAVRKQQPYIEFGKLFKSMKEFKSYIEELAKLCSDVYKFTLTAGKEVEKINKQVDNIINGLEKEQYKVSSLKEGLKELANTLYAIAYWFDAIGTYAQELNHMDHHGVVVMNDLKSKV